MRFSGEPPKGWCPIRAMHYSKIITIEAGKRSGKPCIRGLRITVHDVLEYLASGMSHADILRDSPYLTEKEIRACLAYAADAGRRTAHAVAACNCSTSRIYHQRSWPEVDRMAEGSR